MPLNDRQINALKAKLRPYKVAGGGSVCHVRDYTCDTLPTWSKVGADTGIEVHGALFGDLWLS